MQGVAVILLFCHLLTKPGFCRDIPSDTAGYVVQDDNRQDQLDRKEAQVCEISGQVYKECGHACTRTCSNLYPPCTKNCVARCECPHNKPILHNGGCITAEECDDVESRSPENDGCEISEQVFMECGSACVRTCENLKAPCTMTCVARCQCPFDTPILHNGECIKEDECTDNADQQKDCSDTVEDGEMVQKKDHVLILDKIPDIELPDHITTPPVLMPVLYHDKKVEDEIETLLARQVTCEIPGQEFHVCGHECDRTCANPNPLCSMNCVARCECPYDKPMMHNGVCATPDECVILLAQTTQSTTVTTTTKPTTKRTTTKATTTTTKPTTTTTRKSTTTKPTTTKRTTTTTRPTTTTTKPTTTTKRTTTTKPTTTTKRTTTTKPTTTTKRTTTTKPTTTTKRTTTTTKPTTKPTTTITNVQNKPVGDQEYFDEGSEAMVCMNSNMKKLEYPMIDWFTFIAEPSYPKTSFNKKAMLGWNGDDKGTHCFRGAYDMDQYFTITATEVSTWTMHKVSFETRYVDTVKITLVLEDGSINEWTNHITEVTVWEMTTYSYWLGKVKSMKIFLNLAPDPQRDFAHRVRVQNFSLLAC